MKEWKTHESRESQEKLESDESYEHEEWKMGPKCMNLKANVEKVLTM